MKKSLLMTTALVAAFSATNVCAEDWTISSKETITDEFISRDTPERSNEIVSRLKQEQYELNNKLELLTKADEKFSIAVATILSLGNNAYQIFQSSKVETKREILHLLLSNLKLQDRKISYTLRKPYDYIRSLNKKTPSKKEGVAIGEPDGIRTHDPLIKSQMLYQLSYGPAHLTKQGIMDKKRLVNKKIQKN